MKAATLKLKFSTFLIIASITLSGCTQAIIRDNPLSVAEYKKLDLNDSGGVERWWGDVSPPGVELILKEEADILREQYPNTPPEEYPVQNYLIISGGGANGAFGAGILSGWTESGNRPEFEMVTGTSTGAIIAFFAFLGPEYDDTLRDIYATISREDVYEPHILSGLFGGSSLADTKSLQQQIEKYITPQNVKAIAEEYSKGRTLFIVTTHFDAMRPMIWDIGAIALLHGDSAIPLIRKIFLASAAIPVLFPPVPIEWEYNGKTYTELHVDGGVTRNVFAYPAQINLKEMEKIQGFQMKRHVYVIQNGNAHMQYKPSSTKLIPIAERTVRGLLQRKSNADIERVYNLTQRDDLGFSMIEIPNKFLADQPTQFEQSYMQELLELGRSIAHQENFWFNAPPDQRMEKPETKRTNNDLIRQGSRSEHR